MSPQGHAPQTFTETNSRGGGQMSHTHTQKHAHPHKLEFNLWGEAFREVAMRKKDTDASISYT